MLSGAGRETVRRTSGGRRAKPRRRRSRRRRVGHAKARPAVAMGARWLQDVEALDEQDVGPADGHRRARDHVVGEVGVDGGVRLGGTGLHGGEEAQQCPLVIGLRKALPFEQATARELGVGQPVGRHQRDRGMLRPPRQELPQHPRRGALADSDAARDPDHEWRGGTVLAQEGRGRAMPLGSRRDHQVEQAAGRPPRPR